MKEKKQSRLRAWFRKLMRREILVTTDGKNKYHVFKVELGADNITTALGISEERGDKLLAMCKETFHNKTDVVDVLEEVSKECLHANELAYCTWVVAKHHSIMTQNPLGGIIAAIARDRGE
jgi:hypothetical protein